MDYHKSISAQISSINTLFDNILPTKSSNSNHLTHGFTEEDVQNQPSANIASCSSSTFTGDEEVMKDQGTSTDPTLENQQLKQVRQFFICYRFYQID
jgi:hypothetical protein